MKGRGFNSLEVHLEILFFALHALPGVAFFGSLPLIFIPPRAPVFFSLLLFRPHLYLSLFLACLLVFALGSFLVRMGCRGLTTIYLCPVRRREPGRHLTRNRVTNIPTT